jgi:hypothetical protein
VFLCLASNAETNAPPQAQWAKQVFAPHAQP